MTIARPMEALESNLTSTERVVRWLVEAHAYGDFTSYVQAMYAEGPDALPLDRLAREAADAIRGKQRVRARNQPRGRPTL